MTPRITLLIIIPSLVAVPGLGLHVAFTRRSLCSDAPRSAAAIAALAAGARPRAALAATTEEDLKDLTAAKQTLNSLVKVCAPPTTYITITTNMTMEPHHHTKPGRGR